MRMCAFVSPPAADFFNDLSRFSPAANTWTALSPSGSGPSQRQWMGFAATPDGLLYVFGGNDVDDGNEGWGGVRRQLWLLGDTVEEYLLASSGNLRGKLRRLPELAKRYSSTVTKPLAVRAT